MEPAGIAAGAVSTMTETHKNRVDLGAVFAGAAIATFDIFEKLRRRGFGAGTQSAGNEGIPHPSSFTIHAASFLNGGGSPVTWHSSAKTTNDAPPSPSDVMGTRCTTGQVLVPSENGLLQKGKSARAITIKNGVNLVVRYFRCHTRQTVL